MTNLDNEMKLKIFALPPCIVNVVSVTFAKILVFVIIDSNTASIEDPALPLDTESAHDDDPGAILLNVEPALNDNLGMNTDAPAHDLVAPSGNEEPMRCVNCGIDIMHRRRHKYAYVLFTGYSPELGLSFLLDVGSQQFSGSRK